MPRESAYAKKFEEEYGKLNPAQKEAVEAIEGPVMVVAGPGTGKTRILALRIGNILRRGSAAADEILTLTFTNSGVRAMKERLLEYMGTAALDVRVSTFHAFALELIEEHYALLGFEREPALLSDDEAVFLVDEILDTHPWQYIRPRTNPELYFNDLKHLISLLKRERLSHEEFQKIVKEEIEGLKRDPDSVSTRGASKGKLKKEVERKIESLERTHEVVEFYRIYEERKRERLLMDYDDVLEYAVKLAEEYEDVQADIRERYQYVLVDEHQDSSGIQNGFLKAVWEGVEKPNIFVVGDDRQLIYAFSGASLSYFEEFSHIFGKAKLITLVRNYRSTPLILALADDLLASSITSEKLESDRKEKGDKVALNEYEYPRDEILGAGAFFRREIEKGLSPDECALLVPKNHHVRSAIGILRDAGLPVSGGGSASLFEMPQALSFFRVLKVLAHPGEPAHIAESLLDRASGIPPLEAHAFLKSADTAELSIDMLRKAGAPRGLFGENAIASWGTALERWLSTAAADRISHAVSVIGNELLIHKAKDHDDLIRSVEVVRSFIHLALLFEEKDPVAGVGSFLRYIDRLRSYKTPLPLAVFGKEKGIRVMTLHKSKGLEWDAVWIAHMNEEVFMSEKRSGFTLPRKLKELLKSRDEEIARRELYVGITRAKKRAVISYARENYAGGELELANILSGLPDGHFIRKSAAETEAELLKDGPELYVRTGEMAPAEIADLKAFVKEKYPDTKVSVTLLNNFFECPWKWYFRSFLKLPEVKTVSLALGSAVHSTIEFILKEKDLPGDAAIRAKIEHCLAREGIGGNELARLSKDAWRAVSMYLKDFYPKLAKTRESERSLQFRDKRFPQLLMYGKIDLTERPPEGIVVTDFKTGGPKTKTVIEKPDNEDRLSGFMRQLAMYSYLIESVEKKKVAESRLLFLEADPKDKDILYSTFVSGETIDLLLRDIRDYEEALRDGSWTERPCNARSYGADKECEYCKIAGIYTEKQKADIEAVSA